MFKQIKDLLKIYNLDTEYEYFLEIKRSCLRGNHQRAYELFFEMESDKQYEFLTDFLSINFEERIHEIIKCKDFFIKQLLWRIECSKK